MIHGSPIVQEWRGGWIGLIRNHVGGNVIFAKSVSMSSDAGPGTDDDSSEVLGTDASAFGRPIIPQTIGGNLICHGNVPAVATASTVWASALAPKPRQADDRKARFGGAFRLREPNS